MSMPERRERQLYLGQAPGSGTKAARLIRLVYVSAVAIPRGQGHFRAEISDIMAACERHNRRAGVTGVLVYDRGRFIQMLEGPQAAVDEIYARICEDRRHTEVTVLLKEPASERLFDDWAMAFANASEVPLPTRASSGWKEMDRETLLRRLTEIHDVDAVMSLRLKARGG